MNLWYLLVNAYPHVHYVEHGSIYAFMKMTLVYVYDTRIIPMLSKRKNCLQTTLSHTL